MVAARASRKRLALVVLMVNRPEGIFHRFARREILQHRRELRGDGPGQLRVDCVEGDGHAPSN